MKRVLLLYGTLALLGWFTDSAACRRLSAEEFQPRSTWQTGGLVFHAAFSPDGQTLVASIGRLDRGKVVGHTALGGTVKVFPIEVKAWAVATGKERFTIAGDLPNQGLNFSPDGKTFATCGGELKEGEQFDAWKTQKQGVVKLWDSQTGKEKLKITQERLVSCTAFSPDGKLLATGSFDKTVRLWDATTGKAVAVLYGHRNTLECLAFSPDGKTLASGGYDEIIRLWDVATQKETAILEGENPIGAGRGVFALAFTPDGEFLAAGVYDGVKIWDRTAKKLVHLLRGRSCSALALSPDGKTLAWQAADHTATLWDVASGREQVRWPAHTDRIWSFVFSPDGKLLATASADQTIRFWEVAALQ